MGDLGNMGESDMRGILIAAAALCVTLADPVAAQSFSGSCMVAQSRPVAGQAPEPGSVIRPDGITRPLNRGARVTSDCQIETKGNRASIYLPWKEEGEPGQRIETGFYLAEHTKLHLTPGDDLRYRVDVNVGTVVVQHTGPDRAASLAIVTGRSWVSLQSGVVLVRVTDGGAPAEWELIEGEASYFEGTLPPGPPALAEGGQPLPPGAGEARLFSRSLIQGLESALLNEVAAIWVTAAEEGDFTFRQEETGSFAVDLVESTVTPPLGDQRKDSISQQAISTPVTQPPVVVGSLGAGQTGTTSQVQSLLGSGNPATVLVGARLGRTRIVGSPGSATGGAASVIRNPQVRPPLNLNP